MVESDLPQQSVVPRGRWETTVVTSNAFSPQHPHYEFIDGRKLRNEVPGVFTTPCSSVNDGLQLVVGFGAQHLEACASSAARFIHGASLEAPDDQALSARVAGTPSVCDV